MNIISYWFHGTIPLRIIASLLAKFMGPAWGPPGTDRTQVGPVWATWKLLFGVTVMVMSHRYMEMWTRAETSWDNSQYSENRFSSSIPWWRHQMEAFSALLALCEGNSPVTGAFPSQRPMTRNFDVFFDLHLDNKLNKQSRCRWFEMPSRSLSRHCNAL